MRTYEFDAEIKKQEKVDGAYVEFPYDVEKEFATKGQVKVKASFDGIPYRGSLANMGHSCHILGITQKIRKDMNKQPGDIVHVVIQQDDEPRVIEVPEDLKVKLEENNGAKDFFESLSFSNKKKFVDWITSAKKAETREKRLEEAVEMLSNNIKRA